MNTVTVQLGQTINLGYQYDNYATQVVFPSSIINPIWNSFGTSGTFAIWFRRSGDALGYPIGYPLVTVNNGEVTWNVVETDLANPGQAQVQLRYLIDEQCVMSQVFPAMVADSVDIGTDVPEPMEQWADAIVSAGAGGQPTVATSASAMSDHNTIYLYTGSESGYTNGHIYYWNGSAWTDGGAYGGGSSSGTGLTDDIKQALLTCFEHVAWTDEHGQDYVDALEAALYPPATLVSISAVYTQSGTVYDTDTLDSLRDDLVVTAHYDDSSSEVVTTYTLSGTLAEGTSTITVTYGGKTTSFNVTVTERLTSISAVYTQSGAVYDDATLNDLKTDLVVTAHYADSTTETVTDYTLSGTLTVGTSTITVSYGGKTTTFTVTVSKGIDYTDNPLADVTWYDGYTYNSSGTMVTAANEHCTSKFDAQTCIYALANSDTSANSYVTIFAWDENDVYLGGPGNNNTGRWMLKEGYKYAIKMYGANANKNAMSLMPVDNRAAAVPSFEINLSDYVESITVAGDFYELSVGSILAENGIESSNWDTAINSVNSLCRIDYGYTAAARGIPFDDDFAFGFYTHTTMYMRAKSVGSNNLLGLKNYITQNNIKVKFN